MVMKYISAGNEFFGMMIFHIPRTLTWRQHIRIISIFPLTSNTIEFLLLGSVSPTAIFLSFFKKSKKSKRMPMTCSRKREKDKNVPRVIAILRFGLGARVLGLVVLAAGDFRFVVIPEKVVDDQLMQPLFGFEDAVDRHVDVAAQKIV